VAPQSPHQKWAHLANQIDHSELDLDSKNDGVAREVLYWGLEGQWSGVWMDLDNFEGMRRR